MVEGVKVSALIAALTRTCALKLFSGRAGLSKAITAPRIQKPGLALAGFLRQIKPHRLQVIGNTELDYLASLEPAAARAAVEGLCRAPVACLVVTNGATPPDYLVQIADESSVALIGTPLKTSDFIVLVTAWLQEKLAASLTLHAVLVEVYGVGVLIRGRSGIGKSEAALELVSRGHRLVADDVVEVRCLGPSRLVGRGADLIEHHMEIRGLGIINVEDLFGTLATMREKQIELVAELVEWGSGDATDRLGLDERKETILEVELPLVRIPVRPGRSVATIVEVAVRTHFLRERGRRSAQEFARRIDRAIARQGGQGDREG